MAFPILVNSHSLPILRPYTQFSLQEPNLSMSMHLSERKIYATLLHDIENEAFLKIIKALKECETISYKDMNTIKYTIWSRIRLITAWNRIGPRNVTVTLPLVVGTTRDMIRKVAFAVDGSREPRWALHPKIDEIDISGLSDDRILLSIRHVLSGQANTTSISKSEATQVAEFVAQRLPENFALSRKQILQLIGLIGFRDGVNKFKMVEVKKGLEQFGEREVVRLLKMAETDGRAMEQLKLGIRDIRVKTRQEEARSGN